MTLHYTYIQSTHSWWEVQTSDFKIQSQSNQTWNRNAIYQFSFNLRCSSELTEYNAITPTHRNERDSKMSNDKVGSSEQWTTTQLADSCSLYLLNNIWREYFRNRFGKRNACDWYCDGAHIMYSFFIFYYEFVYVLVLISIKRQKIYLHIAVFISTYRRLFIYFLVFLSSFNKDYRHLFQWNEIS